MKEKTDKAAIFFILLNTTTKIHIIKLIDEVYKMSVRSENCGGMRCSTYMKKKNFFH